MSKFTVQFATASGKVVSEIVEATSERGALAKIEAGGMTPICVEQDGIAAGEKKPDARGNRMRKSKGGRKMRRAVLNFTHQLTAIAESGIPIIAGLKAVKEQTSHPKLREAIGRIVSRIEGGRTLADAIDAEQEIFSDVFAKTLAAGEVAGKVPDVLTSLGDYQEQEFETRSQIRSAMTYPALVVLSLVLASTVMLIVVVPQFASLFKNFKAELPLPTRILMSMSDIVVHHYVLLILGMVGLIMGVRYVLRYKSVKSWLDHRMLKLPVLGNMLIGIYMVRFIELFDLLSRAALPITSALRVTSDSMANEAFHEDVDRILRSVEGGRSLTESFSQTQWLTPLVKRMLAIGEQAGRTDQIFDYLRTYYKRQTQRSIKLLSTLIEPIMIVGLAGVVLFFALSIFLPMWKLLKIIGTA